MQCGSLGPQYCSSVTEVEEKNPLPQALFQELEEFVSELAGLSLEDACVSVELAGSAVELAGSFAELAASAVELACATDELAGVASELLDSIREDMASMTELLMGSWLSGMSTILPELLDFFSAWLELPCCSSAWLELVPASGESTESGLVTMSPVELVLSSFAEVLSSQAFSVKAPNMPSVAASVLLAANEMDLMPVIFFFSIFIFFPSALNFYIRPLEGGDHAHHG